jgi:ubiquitin-protein ligase
LAVLVLTVLMSCAQSAASAAGACHGRGSGGAEGVPRAKHAAGDPREQKGGIRRRGRVLRLRSPAGVEDRIVSQRCRVSFAAAPSLPAAIELGAVLERRYGDQKTDVGISYLSAVRLCSESLTSVAGWPPALVELLVEFLDAVKAPMKKDDWTMTCFLIANMEEEGFEDITRDDVVEFLTEDEEEGNFRTMHYDWLRYLQTGEAEPYKYLDVAEWAPTADPAHPEFEPMEEDQGPGPGAIVGAQVEQKGENPFLSRQSSTYLPSGKVQVFFPNAEDGDVEIRDRQKSDVERHTQLQASGDIEGARALKKTIMQQRISLAHRYTTILIEYHANTGMYAGGVFHFLFRLPKDYPIKAPLCHCLTPIWHPNILHDPDSAPREQNVCCSYLHDSSFADSSERGYEPGMSLWKVVWGICLLLHRFDTEGLGIFTLSNPLNKDAADQFLRDEAGFIEKAEEYTARYATMDYHKTSLKKWHEFYPESFDALYDSGVALGRASSIDKRLPQTTLQQDETAASTELQAVDHPASPASDAECCVYFIPIDTFNFVEYRVAPTGRWWVHSLHCAQHPAPWTLRTATTRRAAQLLLEP